jgi:2-oxoisovalerate dehydrogenase E1 component alpha subunit
MVRLREMDTILQNAQRQGRISFYMTCTGEEAIHMGAAAALENGDHLFCQYREQGLLMWRGFTLEQFTNQCFSNDRDLGKGRQMPIHYGSRALNYHTVSSPLGTQLPQAVGAAYRLKLMGKPNIAVAIFGDGCASTTDFHAALNFAATLSSPTLFFCRNNGYAISTPVTDQYVAGMNGHFCTYTLYANRFCFLAVSPDTQAMASCHEPRGTEWLASVSTAMTFSPLMRLSVKPKSTHWSTMHRY